MHFVWATSKLVNQQLTLPRRHSQLDAVASLPLLPACVFIIRETVRHPTHFLLGKFVREPNCSWTGAFVNRGSTVDVFDGSPSSYFFFPENLHDIPADWGSTWHSTCCTHLSTGWQPPAWAPVCLTAKRICLFRNPAFLWTMAVRGSYRH
jgi:hypothetical protein